MTQAISADVGPPLPPISGRGLTLTVAGLFGIAAGGALVLAGLEVQRALLVSGGWIPRTVDESTGWFLPVSAVSFWALLVGSVLWLLWVHMTVSNNHRAMVPERYGPGEAVVLCAVPLLSLVTAGLVMSDLARAASSRPALVLVRLTWVAVILFVVTGGWQFSAGFGDLHSTGPDIVRALRIAAVAAVSAATVIVINRAQWRRLTQPYRT